VGDRIEQHLDEIVRLLALMMRQNAENQTEAIRLLTQAGFEPTRIAQLLGTTPATVRTAKARAK
jgi:DNA-directed RNA polymerase specialized sigma24 family protein